MTAPVLRPAWPEDISACVALYVAAYQAPPYDGSFDGVTARTIIEEMLERHPETCFVAEVEGAVAGFVLCATLAGVRATIEEFAVDPRHQGRGLGDALLNHALEWFRERGYPAVELIADRGAPAYRFYVRRGFRESSEYRLMSVLLEPTEPGSETDPTILPRGPR